MASKFYAVKEGRKTGVFNTWDECKKQVLGYSNAKYKSFATKQEAIEYLKPSKKTKTNRSIEEILKTEIVAYVDGSYDASNNLGSYGMVIIHKDGEQYFNGLIEDKSLLEMRNVAGEIKGAEAAMKYALDNGYKAVTIYHDYIGISEWCNGNWRANKEGTKAYKEFYDKVNKKIDVNFIKVKGHSGNIYNDLADKLARRALFDE